MPLDLSFSLWVFYLFWIGQRVFFSLIGWTTARSLQTQQRVGAWIAIGILALWTTRHHIVRGLRGMFSTKFDDALYRMAVGGLILEMAFVIGFWLLAGLSPWGVLTYLGIYLVVCIAITRMRAELGPPTHGLYRAHPY